MHVADYLGMVHEAEQQLQDAFMDVAKQHGDEPDVMETCKLLGSWSEKHVKTLKPIMDRYGEKSEGEPKQMRRAIFHGPRKGDFGMLRDLQDLYLMASEVDLSWTVLFQAANALRDKELIKVCSELSGETDRQIRWLNTRIKQAAPQTLVAPP